MKLAMNGTVDPGRRLATPEEKESVALDLSEYANAATSKGRSVDAGMYLWAADMIRMHPCTMPCTNED